MRVTFVGLFIALLFAAATPAAAQDYRKPPVFAERDVKAAIAEALRAMPSVKCGGEPCPAPTPEEFANPPVQVEEARLAMLTGAKSALLSWCGLDWQSRAYSLMMRAFLARYKPHDRGLQVLKMVHAQQLGRDVTNLQMLKTCSPEIRAQLEAENPSIIEQATPPAESLLRDEAVSRMLHLVLDRLPEAKCGKKPCTPATPEEKAKPPVSIEDARLALKTGILSGNAQHCGLDWKEKVFKRLMTRARQKLKMNDRQLAIMGVLHGAMQEYVITSIKARGSEACTAKKKADVERQMKAP